MNGGAAYSFIISLDYRYLPSRWHHHGFYRGFGVGAKTYFPGVYLKMKNTKIPSLHGEILPPSQEGISHYDFLKQTLGVPDIAGAVLGSICSLAPLIFKQRIRSLIRKLKINRVY
jgi:hypothetical protein